MRIQSLKQSVDVASTDELKRALLNRFDGKQDFYELTHYPRLRPRLRIQVNGDLAFLHYSSKERDAGFVSIGGGAGLDANGTTSFPLNTTGECHEVMNDQVVSLSDAMKAAEDFLRSDGLPPSIKWFEL